MTIDADYLVTTTTTVTRAACATTAPQIPSITAAPNARLGEGSPQGITDGGKRDAQLPDYLTSYQPAQVSSACTCLSSTQAQATATITSTATITGSIEVSSPSLSGHSSILTLIDCDQVLHDSQYRRCRVLPRWRDSHSDKHKMCDVYASMITLENSIRQPRKTTFPKTTPPGLLGKENRTSWPWCLLLLNDIVRQYFFLSAQQDYE